MKPGNFPPVSDTKKRGPALPASWLDNPVVLHETAVGTGGVETAALDEGIYTIFASASAWINAGETPVLNTAAALAERPKWHAGGYYSVAVRQNQKIGVRSDSDTIFVQIVRAV